MRERPLHSSPSSGQTPKLETQSGPYRPFWVCLPIMLVLSVFVLLLFGVSWWTALIVVLLLACPAAMGVAIYSGLFRDRARRIGRPGRPG